MGSWFEDWSWLLLPGACSCTGCISKRAPFISLTAPFPPRFEVELQSLRMRLAAEHQMQLDRADAGGMEARVWG